MQGKVNVVATVICLPVGMSSIHCQSATRDFAQTVVVNRTRKELSSNRDRMTLIYLLAGRGSGQSVALCRVSQLGGKRPTDELFVFLQLLQRRFCQQRKSDNAGLAVEPLSGKRIADDGRGLAQAAPPIGL